MPRVQAVFFDLDATLIDYDDAAYEATRAYVVRGVAQAYPSIDAGRLLEAHTVFNNAQWNATTSIVRAPSGASEGRAIWLETWRAALRQCGCSDEPAAALASELYESHRQSSYRLFNDVIDLLDNLRGHIPMALITNGPSDTQRDKLRVTGIDPYFDAVLVSGEVGVGKPDAAIFRLALDQLGVDPTGTWHIGDNPRLDVVGAHNAGVRSVWLNRLPKLVMRRYRRLITRSRPCVTYRRFSPEPELLRHAKADRRIDVLTAGFDAREAGALVESESLQLPHAGL